MAVGFRENSVNSAYTPSLPLKLLSYQHCHAGMTEMSMPIAVDKFHVHCKTTSYGIGIFGALIAGVMPRERVAGLSGLFGSIVRPQCARYQYLRYMDSRHQVLG